MNDRDDNNPLAAELERLASGGRGYECELRSETVRWRWSIAAWEIMHAPPEESLVPDIVAVDDEVVVVFGMLDTVC